MHEPKGKRAILGAAIIAACSFAGGLYLGRYHYPLDLDLMTGDCNKNYSLLRADLDCTSANDDYARVARIQDRLNSYIDSEKSSGRASRVSVFFRDLSSRRWAAVEKGEQYAPGSLLKVVLAIAYYKLSEIEPSILEQEYVYQPKGTDANEIESYKPRSALTPGARHSVDQLIERMIVDSDNEAATLLSSSVDQTFLRKVFVDMGIRLPDSGGSETNFATVESYSGMLRSLYLASYLNIDNSQKILSQMAKSTFTGGIARGVPSGVTVAHKFGEREVIDSTTNAVARKELHDCGIVYKEEQPYILCVMTEGKSYDDLERILSEVSKLVFESE